MNAMLNATLAIVSGIITLAIVAVLMSKRAQTPDVLSAAGGALSNVIKAAVSPVTGDGGGSFSGVPSGGGFARTSFDTSSALDIIATAGQYFA